MKLLKPFLPLLILATAAQAQTPPCASMNDATSSVVNAIYSQSSLGPNVYGWQYSPTQTIVVQALQLFTANNYITYSMGLEIWSDDSSTSLPKARLAGGYWKITKSATASWQGTNLDKAVPMLQGNKYWIVFIDPYWSVVPIETGGTVLPVARQAPGTINWTATSAQALKFRLFCSQLDQQNVKVKGTACASTVGVGTAFANQAPALGNAGFMVEGSGFPSGAPVALLLGSNPNWPSLPILGANPACFIYTDILLTLASSSGTGNVRDPFAAAGQVVFSLPVPANPSLSGGVVPAQLAGVDSASTYSLPIVTSNALLLTLR